jgi:hypothetical protein
MTVYSRVYKAADVPLWPATLAFRIGLVGMLMVLPAAAQQVTWCTDEASGGYILDPNVPSGWDKSLPRAFFASRFSLIMDGDLARVNLQGLGEEALRCTQVPPSTLQCVGSFKILIVDTESKRFNLAQVKGDVGGSKEALVVRFGRCL